MGKILASFLMPHPPIIIPEVGKGEEKKIQKTIDAMNDVSKTISKLRPQTVIIISPHGYVFRDAVCAYGMPDIAGDLGYFGAPQVKMGFENNMELTERIIEEANLNGIKCLKADERLAARYDLDLSLDHGAVVPLYFITKQYNEFKLVHISYGFLAFKELYRFGTIIQNVIKSLTDDVVVVASGDLSHKLTPNSPNGYTPKGNIFDEKILELLEHMDSKSVMEMDKALIDEAAECGFRSILIMMGILDKLEIAPRVISHEGPFGVGYGVAEFLVKSYALNSETEVKKEMDPYVRLAKESLEYYITRHSIMPVPEGLPEEMYKKRTGAFVSLKKDGELRGCIGTIMPVRKNIAEEIIYNAVSAGTEDPRFYPVTEGELNALAYSVDVLTIPEPIIDKSVLDPKRYGVVVKKGFRTGVLLPDLEGVDTVEEQLSIALRKAGIRPDEVYEMLRFEVIRHE
ncbi:MAG: AmmeMemoRadiSam system protein A [Thermoanaerobacteraceae bacterium]|nr:AmmeMemoRadiSam system protein A [Thermoanaerobacteraceae bacterium]